ncbi:MAG: hypothetical protein GY814_18645 [Gammaproteobacteria bacterium]|nr:hypothetical protein [Gammaproteobacteria bacterium]
MKLFSFRNLRILLLLVLLAFAAIYTKQQRMHSTSWLEPLEIVVFPINGDNSEKTAAYIANLSDSSFANIDRFTASEAKRHNLYQEQPTITRLGPAVNSIPPPPPPKNAFFLKIGLWSLKLRYWAWHNTPDNTPNNRVRIFVLYHGMDNGKPLQHSLGLQKGLLGIVHAYAMESQSKQNNLVIAHELLHTVGASDKYDNQGNPVFPEGYAQPERRPLHPQFRAEIMAGRIPDSSTHSNMALSLDSCIIGTKTASEISWLDVN